MHPADCPEGWDYDKHPDKHAILPPAIISVLTELRTGQLDSLSSLRDTKPIHHRFFNQLTPPELGYFAGNYRGSEFKCLKYYGVKITGDDRVGFDPSVVSKFMAELADIIIKAVSEIDGVMSLPDNQLCLRDKVLYLVAAVCCIFEIFLRIHPYANGNGHIGRFCVWAFLGRYNFWPRTWPIEPRPADPPYTELIKKYRDGDKAILESFIMGLLARY
jgi:hypothetical protein